MSVVPTWYAYGPNACLVLKRAERGFRPLRPGDMGCLWSSSACWEANPKPSQMLLN